MDVPFIGDLDRWPVIRFPSAGTRERFLDMIRACNRIEDLPRVDAEPLYDGVCVRLWLWRDDQRFPGVLRLAHSYGGWFPAGEREAAS